MAGSKERIIENWPLLIIVLIVSIATISMVLSDGLILNGDFPTFIKTQDYGKVTAYTWNSYGSLNTMDTLDRYFFTVITSIGQLLNISSETFTKLMIFFGFIIAGISSYLAVVFFFKNKTDNKQKIYLNISAVIASLFYAFNIWSFHKIGHWFLWIAYAILPIFFISVICSFRKPSGWKYIFSTAILWSIASMTPHMTVFFGLVFISMFFIFALKYRRNKQLIELIKSLFFVVTLYLLINLYWIYPYAVSSKSATISPSYVVTNEVVQMLSRDSSIANVLRLTEDWWLPRVISVSPPQDSVLFPLWLYASFLIPILTFLVLFLKRKNRHALFFSALAIIGIFLTMGSKAPFDIYSKFIFYTPFISKFGWLFRDPDKFGFLIALSYSFLIAITSLEVFKYLENIKHKKILQTIFVILIISSIALYAYPIYKDTVEKVFNPIVVPNEFSNLNSYLANTDTEKVLFMPYSSGITTWSKNHTIGKIYQMSSIKPNIQPSSPDLNYYYNYFTKSVILNDTAQINNFIYPFGTSYIIYHNDTLDSNNLILLNKLSLSDELRNIDDVGFFKIFRTNRNAGQLNIPGKNIVIIGGLDKFTTLNAINSYNSIDTSSFFTDQNLITNKMNYMNLTDSLILDNDLDSMLSVIDSKYMISSFDATIHHNPSMIWSKAGATDPLHGPFHPYLEQRKIENWDFDYSKGLVFTWANSIIDAKVIPSEKDLLKAYNFEENYDDWDINAKDIQILESSNDAHSGKQSIQSILNESKWGWKTINSPVIPVTYSTPYRYIFYVKGENSESVHAKITEYDTDNKIINANYLASIGTGTFDWKEISFDYKPEDKRIAYMQLQIWHGHETKQPFPNKIWIDDVKVYDLTQYMEPVTLDMDVNVEKDGAYDLFVRYFKNKDGGAIDVAMDGQRVQKINTADQLNKFVWKNIGTLDLKKGKHKLTLTNVEGFNAVNIFALIPSDEYAQMEAKTDELLAGKRLMYVFEAESDLYRENAPISKKYGGEASNGEVLEFNGNSTAWQTVSIMRSDDYYMAIKINGDFNVKIDDKTYHVFSNTSNFTYIGPVELEKGDHNIEFTLKSNKTNSSDLDVVWMYSTDTRDETLEDVFTVNETPATVQDYKKHDPTLYSIKVNASKPFMLSFAESYDPLWYAQVTAINGAPVNKDKVRPVPLYSVINGFWINETGDLDITIEYEPQRWFYIGAAISLATLILSILYLMYDWRKNRRRKEESGIKTEQKPLGMPKIVTKTVGAINDRSRLIIKRRSNPELKALHNHVVHNEYHYHKKKTIGEFIEDLKKKLSKKKTK